MWKDQMTEFRTILHNKLISPPCELSRWAADGRVDDEVGLYLVNVPFSHFMCAMLLDDTTIQSSRPGSGPNGNYTMAPRRVGAHYIQRAFYSGYFCGHGLKYQTILLPNGLYGSVWGASMQHNDTGIFNLSGLEDYMAEMLEPDENGDLPCCLADGIFSESALIMTTKVHNGATSNDKQVYKKLASIRQPIELQYGLFFNLFRIYCKKRHSNCLRMPKCLIALAWLDFFN